jgi:hypothetical protein
MIRKVVRLILWALLIYITIALMIELKGNIKV